MGGGDGQKGGRVRVGEDEEASRGNWFGPGAVDMRTCSRRLPPTRTRQGARRSPADARARKGSAAASPLATPRAPAAAERAAGRRRRGGGHRAPHLEKEISTKRAEEKPLERGHLVPRHQPGHAAEVAPALEAAAAAGTASAGRDVVGGHAEVAAARAAGAEAGGAAAAAAAAVRAAGSRGGACARGDGGKAGWGGESGRRTSRCIGRRSRVRGGRSRENNDEASKRLGRAARRPQRTWRPDAQRAQLDVGQPERLAEPVARAAARRLVDRLDRVAARRQ